MSEQFLQLKKLYEEYVRQVRNVYSQSSYFTGLFSSQGGPKSDPCHTAFYEAVEKQIAQYVAEPDGDPEEILRWILRAPEIYKNERAYWYLIAVQNHAKMIIPILTDSSRNRIGVWYSQFLPKRHRYPIQEEILNLLLK